MDLKVMMTTFGMVFLAELGDKTQLATLCFAAENESWLAVFVGSACALVLTSLLAVVVGCGVSRFFSPYHVRVGAGVLFVLLGLWMLVFSGGK